MNIRYFRYPWRVSLPDLVEADHTCLPVASGACCVIDGAENFHASLPEQKIALNGRSVKICEIPDTDDQARLHVFANAGESIYATEGAYEGLRTDEDETASELNMLIEEALRFVQRVEDIIADNLHSGSTVHSHVPWDVALSELASTDWQGDLARKPLIVELAERQGVPLKEIARGAKRVLRRVRDKERVSRAREFDKATLIRIAQLPGRTIAQKAGPKQRIPAVKRYESTDTLENRVVEHFCRLAQGEWHRTQNNERTVLRNDEWGGMAESFALLCRRVQTSEDFLGLPRLKTPCTAPNYTLEQNLNYRSIWTGYKKLIHRQSEQEECWAWSRRVFMNRALVFVGELFNQAFPTDRASHLPYAKHMRARLNQSHGLWLDVDSFPGPRVFQGEDNQGYLTAYLLSPEDIRGGPASLGEIAKLNGDGYILTVSDAGIRVSPFYCFVGANSPEAVHAAYRDLRQVFSRICKEHQNQDAGFVEFSAPLFVWADFLRPGVSVLENQDGVWAAGIPVINDHWISPSTDLVTGIQRSLSS